jgi:ABC-type uncharacterized transport system fused permease/ATPase subunit
MDDRSMKKLALFALALGKCRGLLYGIKTGEIDLEEIDQILSLTSLSHLAEVLGVEEDELSLDWNDYLSPNERLVN